MFKIDRPILFLVLILSFLSLLTFFSASYYYSLKLFNNSYFYFQRFFLKITCLGFLFFFIGNFLAKRLKSYKLLFIYSFIFFYLTIFLGFLPKFKIAESSAARWVNLGFINFQPSEILKPLGILFFIFLLLELKRIPFLSKCIVFIIGIILFLLPIYLQPSYSNVAIIFLSLITVFFSFLKSFKEILISSLIFILLFLILSLLATTFWDYRKERIISFLTKGSEHGEKYFQVEQSLLGVSSGGLFGKGLGNSEIKIIGLPQMLTDSIFVIYAEELGFVGSVFLIILFLFLIFRIIILSLISKDEIKKVFAFSLAVWIFVQTFLHIASNIALIFPTGVILPFFSYGASGQLAIYFSLGIVSRNE